MIKKLFTLFLCLNLLLLNGCTSKAVNDSSSQNKIFSQTMTIVTMLSPPKCKTTTNITTINKVLNVLGQIEKAGAVPENSKGGWYYLIKLNVDGTELTYTVGEGLFTDIDGKQYNITNSEEISEKLKQIYNEIDEPQVYYT